MRNIGLLPTMIMYNVCCARITAQLPRGIMGDAVCVKIKPVHWCQQYMGKYAVMLLTQ